MGGSGRRHELDLMVLEGYPADLGRGVVRIDSETVDVLKVRAGDILEVRGKKATFTKCLVQSPTNEDTGMIRVDRLARINDAVATSTAKSTAELNDALGLNALKTVCGDDCYDYVLSGIQSTMETYMSSSLWQFENFAAKYIPGHTTASVLRRTAFTYLDGIQGGGLRLTRKGSADPIAGLL